MATAKLHDGVAIVAYNATGQAIDSEGRVIKGAPKPPKDTPRDQQPGSLGAPTEAERIAVAVARAMQDPDAVLKNAGVSTAPALVADDDEETDEDDGSLPNVDELSDHLAGITDVDEVKAMRKQDKRKTARPKYDARIAEIESGA